MTAVSLPKTYRVKSFGCQMNVYDGERMADLLGAQGIAPAADGIEADLVVLNTCHIRERATEKVFSDIGRLKRADGSAPLIAVAGCVAQAEGEEILRRAPTVSLVVGSLSSPFSLLLLSTSSGIPKKAFLFSVFARLSSSPSVPS